jgi:hypothetical protein
MAKITTDRRNYRKHSDKNKRIINKSLKDLGAGRSILIDSTDEIIAGNQTFEEAQRLKIPVRIIETDGNELIAVKRRDLKPDDEKRKKLAIVDNHSSDTSEFDVNMLMLDYDELELDDYELVLKEETIVSKKQSEAQESLQLTDKMNYVILTFENDIDWLNAMTELEIKEVKTLRRNGKEWARGVGRVMNGVEAIRKIKGELQTQ